MITYTFLFSPKIKDREKKIRMKSSPDDFAAQTQISHGTKFIPTDSTFSMADGDATGTPDKRKRNFGPDRNNQKFEELVQRKENIH